MKNLLIIGLTLFFASCGKKTETTIIQYDDTNLKAQYDAINMIQDSRISLLEAKLQSNDDQLDLFIDELDTLKDTVESLEASEVKLIKVCNSKEYLVKLGNDYFAVYMINNAFGTYLGKLDLNVNYRTTDQVKADFKINSNNQLVCL